MKKFSAIILVLTLMALSVSFTGCSSTPKTGDGGSVTNAPPVIDQQTLDAAAIVLRSAARNASALAISEKPENRKYVQLAVTSMDTFLTGSDYTPGALVEALKPVLKEVKDLKVGLAVNTVTDLYDAFFGRYVKGRVASVANGNALLFLTNLRQGAAEALDLTAATPPPR
jgi:hypothetical protein